MNNYEATINNYISKFTPEQLEGMRKRMAHHMVEHDHFMIGPKGDKQEMYFVTEGHKRTIMFVTSVGDIPMYSIETPTSPTRIKDLLDNLLHQMLGMVALWDITMKDMWIKIAKKEGLDP